MNNKVLTIEKLVIRGEADDVDAAVRKLVNQLRAAAIVTIERMEIDIRPPTPIKVGEPQT